jgi:Mg2+-importing ATPase
MASAEARAAARTAFWREEASALFTRLSATAEGLSAGEAARRLEHYGPNAAVTAARAGIAANVLRRIAEPLVAILLLAAVVSGLTGDWQSAVIILLIVLGSTVLDLVQEHKAQATIEALRQSVAVTAAVVRDGETVERPVAEIVPGDVVKLRGGDLVPADGIVLDAVEVLADEAALTGEPYAVDKRPGPCDATSPAEAFSALFAGTSLVGGEASMLVVNTGAATRFGAAAAALRSATPPTTFERGLHELGMLILKLTGFLVLFVLLAQLLRHGLTLEGFLFAVALAVGLTPELLPMITTVTLARGGARMARRRVVVKRLSAIHDLGAIDVLCTDKTGTLTEARIALAGAFAPDGADDAGVIELLRRNSRLARGVRSSLDTAALSGDSGAADGWALVDDAPFDFQRRRASVLVTDGERYEMITKGAPEAVLPLCTRLADRDGGVDPLTPQRREHLQQLVDGKGRAGLRLLAIARREMAATCAGIAPADETGLVLMGFASFVDPPKPSAATAIERLTAAGVRVKIISGDARPVVEHVVSALRLDHRGVLSGDEVARLSDSGLTQRVGAVDLFVRVSPEQKARIVAALRRRGHTVGFMGDGINDAPAIHAADVGISVEGGTDVAREAADIIVLASDLGLVADGVTEGRRTYANIMKYVRMGTSSNFGNMLSMAAASVFLPFLPLAPLQVLLNNLLYDLSEIGIPFDTAEPAELATPRAWDMRAVFGFALVMGPLSSLFDIITFAWLRLVVHADVAAFRTAWFVESIATQILVIFIIRTSGPFWRSRPDHVLVATSLGGLGLALLTALTPLGVIVGFEAPSPAVLLGSAAITAIYLGCAEGAKRFALALPGAAPRRPKGRARRRPGSARPAGRPAPHLPRRADKRSSSPAHPPDAQRQENRDRPRA